MNKTEIATVERLRREGKGLSAIAKETGISINTIKSHFSRHGVPAPRLIRVCLFCTAEIKTTDHFCSDACRAGWYESHSSDEQDILRLCKSCGKPFEPRQPKQVYCSKQCFYNDRYHSKPPITEDENLQQVLMSIPHEATVALVKMTTEILLSSGWQPPGKADYAALRRMVESLRPEVEISVYPAIVEHLNKDDLREDVYLSGAEYSDFLTDCYGDAGEAAENIALSRNRRYFCTAELENCYVVDEKGNLYKCWDEIGKEEFVCMNLLDRTQVNYCAISRFVADDPFDANSKCRMCKFLPLCFGGCRYQKNYFGRTKCSFTSAGMIQYIENKYFHL